MLVCFILTPMIYGLIFLEHIKHSAQSQRNTVALFAQKHKLTVDKFISFDKNPDISILRSGDSIICYSWDCLCTDRDFLRQTMQNLFKQNIYVYSTTSKYFIDKSMDTDAVMYGFNMYDDIWNTFISYRNTLGAKARVENGHAPGRPFGAKNRTHVLDGKEKTILNMFSRGASMYAIAKKTGVSSMTIKRFLNSCN